MAIQSKRQCNKYLHSLNYSVLLTVFSVNVVQTAEPLKYLWSNVIYAINQTRLHSLVGCCNDCVCFEIQSSIFMLAYKRGFGKKWYGNIKITLVTLKGISVSMYTFQCRVCFPNLMWVIEKQSILEKIASIGLRDTWLHTFATDTWCNSSASGCRCNMA